MKFKLPSLKQTLSRRTRTHLSQSDSSSPQRGQKAAAVNGQFKPKGPK